MLIFALIAVLVAVGLAIELTSETRDYDDRDRRGWWPGASR